MDILSENLGKDKFGINAGRKTSMAPTLRSLSILDKRSPLKLSYIQNAKQYIDYSTWEERGYYSTQWEEKLQQQVYLDALKQSSGKTYFGNPEISENYKNKIQKNKYKKKQTPVNTKPENSNKDDDYEDNNLCSVPLYPIDIEKDILDDFTMVFYGRRRSGKTYGQRWLAYHLRHRFRFVCVITGTKLNNFWEQYVPKEFIYDIEEISTILPEIMERQANIIGNPELGIDPRMMLILDDVLNDKYMIRFSKELSKIWTNGRHLKISPLITLQDCKAIPPDLRENTDLAIMFRVYEGGRKEIIYKEWMSYMPKDQAPQFFWKHTGKVDPKTGIKFDESKAKDPAERFKMIPQALVVLQGDNTDNLQNIYKKFMATDPGPFILGDPAYYEAAATGKYHKIYQTDRRFKKKKRSTELAFLKPPKIEKKKVVNISDNSDTSDSD